MYTILSKGSENYNLTGPITLSNNESVSYSFNIDPDNNNWFNYNPKRTFFGVEVRAEFTPNDIPVTVNIYPSDTSEEISNSFVVYNQLFDYQTSGASERYPGWVDNSSGNLTGRIEFLVTDLLPHETLTISPVLGYDFDVHYAGHTTDQFYFISLNNDPSNSPYTYSQYNYWPEFEFNSPAMIANNQSDFEIGDTLYAGIQNNSDINSIEPDFIQWQRGFDLNFNGEIEEIEWSDIENANSLSYKITTSDIASNLRFIGNKSGESFYSDISSVAVENPYKLAGTYFDGQTYGSNFNYPIFGTSPHSNAFTTFFTIKPDALAENKTVELIDGVAYDILINYFDDATYSITVDNGYITDSPLYSSLTSSKFNSDEVSTFAVQHSDSSIKIYSQSEVISESFNVNDRDYSGAYQWHGLGSNISPYYTDVEGNFVGGYEGYLFKTLILVVHLEIMIFNVINNPDLLQPDKNGWKSFYDFTELSEYEKYSIPNLAPDHSRILYYTGYSLIDDLDIVFKSLIMMEIGQR